ncbi:CPBP family intramembrane glutamic endopeptidase [Actinocorallia sp. A-T 12471]|uniref:CPBP family intramembrane glutamic endopeptidase n=1 Tax=Actinocorallia sp. A-T 12471 TaxID=3089813 RepID=UPI0029CAE4CF|nr:CPBP family intramembrane glutamic endopeptidase [Actinocorallia sp. A-T 12471]MDX6741224.1 CPBP family intramembrane glutamic endopeptidase [Actinocorallia sp. A-T 12471]
MTADASLPSLLPDRRTLTREIWLVFALSLGASALAALISFTGSLTAEKALAEQTASLVTDRYAGRPWLGLSWQLYGIAVSLVPVALVAHFLARSGEPMGRTLGVSWIPRGLDLLRGAGVAAAIGGSGLALYLGAQAVGANLTIVPTTLGDVWWRIPVLVLSAIENAVLEEVIVLGYLLHRLDQLGWSRWKADLTSAGVRSVYHLYQGIGGLVGNFVMGVIFAFLYRHWGRVMPLLVAHALIDIVAFVGWVALAGKVSWLPGA